MCRCHFSRRGQGDMLDEGLSPDSRCTDGWWHWEGVAGLVSPAKPCLATHTQELMMIYCKAAQADIVVLFGGASELMIASHLRKYCGKCSARRELIQKQNRFIFRSG